MEIVAELYPQARSFVRQSLGAVVVGFWEARG